jgi:hypothetical protein
MDDARLSVAPADRRAWFEAVQLLADTHETVGTLVGRAQAILPDGGRRPAVEPPPPVLTEAREVGAAARELQSRVAVLYRELDGFVGPPTSDQRSQMTYYLGILKQLQGRVERLERGK